MLAFRSEGEARRWSETGSAADDRPPGAVFPSEQLWQLARVWYDDRFDLHWRRRTARERQRLLESCGLTGPFWHID